MNIQCALWKYKCKIKKILYKLSYKQKIRLSDGVEFRDGFRILISNDAVLSIGENTFFNNFCSITCRNKILIGKDCLFGENVKIYDHNHKFRKSDIPISLQGFSVGIINIGNNCWFGSNVVILKGANIGNHCVISAGCVVDSEIPDNTILYRNGNRERIG